MFTMIPGFDRQAPSSLSNHNQETDRLKLISPHRPAWISLVTGSPRRRTGGCPKFKGEEMETVGKITIMILMIVLGSIYSGWILSIIWSWFMVPVFGLPSLSIAAGIGIKITVMSLVNPRKIEQTKDREFAEILADSFSQSFIGPTVVLFIAWIVRFWM
jgi:hypothetical protein